MNNQNILNTTRLSKTCSSNSTVAEIEFYDDIEFENCVSHHENAASQNPPKPENKAAASLRQNGMNKVRALRASGKVLSGVPGLTTEAHKRYQSADNLAKSIQIGVKKADEVRIERGESKPVEKLEIRMANAIICANHGLTLIERRLVAMGIARLREQHYSYTQGAESPLLKIDAAEWSRACGVSKSTAYEQLRDACNRLSERWLTWGNNDEKNRTNLQWVSSSEYQNGQGCAALKFSPDILPYLSDIPSEFTRYKLFTVLKLKRVTSWRILELCAQWSSQGKVILKLSVLHTALEAGPLAQASFKQFKNKMLVPALGELKEAGFEVKLKLFRESRTIVRVQFTFKRHCL
ncbi:MAG: replication initiation protein [Burkholderiaceae bacterium]